MPQRDDYLEGLFQLEAAMKGGPLPSDPIGFHPLETLGKAGIMAGRAMFPFPGSQPPEEPERWKGAAAHQEPPRDRPLDSLTPEPSFMQSLMAGVPDTSNLGGVYNSIAGSIGAQSPGVALLSRAKGALPRGTLRSGAGPDIKDVNVLPARQGQTLPMKHYSHEPGIETVQASRYGTGIQGQEAQRLALPSGEPLRQRASVYTDISKMPESGLGPHRVDLTGSGMYNLADDPNNYAPLARRIVAEEQAAAGRASGYKLSNPPNPDEVLNRTEKLIRDAGYEGVHVPGQGIGTRFADTPVAGQTPAESLGHHVLGNENIGKGVARTRRRYVGGEQAGDYIGAPVNVNSPQGLGAMRKRLMGMALGGKLGRHWYEKSGEAIHRGFSGAEAPTKAYTAGLAITSPDTSVGVNAQFATRGHNQAISGAPIHTGKYHQSMSPRIAEAYAGGTLEGRKVATFYGNILHRMFPDIPQGATADVWMARAFGMKGDKLTDAQFDFIEFETQNIADMLNKGLKADLWDKKQVQAAIWTQMKHQTEKNTSLAQAAKSFDEGISSSMAVVPQESIPGQTADILQGLQDATPAQRQLYHDHMQTVLTDDYGRNIIGRELGALQGETVPRIGVFEGRTGPLAASPLAVSRRAGRASGQAKVDEGLGTWVTQTRNGKPVEVFKPRADLTPDEKAILHWHDNQVDAASANVATAKSATQAKLLNQDAGAWVRVFSDNKAPKYAQDAALIKQNLTADQVIELQTALARQAGRNTSPYPIIGTHDGYAITNPGKPGTTDFTNQEFQKHLNDAIDEVLSKDTEVIMSGHDGRYFENNWARQPAGEGYDEVIRGTGETLSGKSATIQEKLRPRIEEVQRTWKDMGYEGPRRE